MDIFLPPWFKFDDTLVKIYSQESVFYAPSPHHLLVPNYLELYHNENKLLDLHNQCNKILMQSFVQDIVLTD